MTVFTKKVYRLEHPTYGTPYQTKLDEVRSIDPEKWDAFEKMTYTLRISHCNPKKNRPSVLDEFRYNFNKGVHFCGCVSLAKLKKWFCNLGLWQMLMDLGYQVIVLELNRWYVIEGEIQCIYAAERAERVGRYIWRRGKLNYIPYPV